MPIVLAFAFGSGALVFLLIVAVFIENPSPLLILVSRVILAIGCASVAAALPGFIDLELSPHTDIVVRAGGAMAVFVLVYLVNPGSLLIPNSSDCSSPEAPHKKFLPVAEDWLKIVDSGNLKKAYESASAALQKDFDFDSFESVYENTFRRFGAMKSREFQGMRAAQKLQTGECGNFRFISFFTTFQIGDEQTEFTETILLTVEDNHWVVRDHNLQPNQQTGP